MDTEYEEWLEARRYVEPEELEHQLTVEELVEMTEDAA